MNSYKEYDPTDASARRLSDAGAIMLGGGDELL